MFLSWYKLEFNVDKILSIFTVRMCVGSDTDERADKDDGLVVCVLMSLCDRVCCICDGFSSPECAASPSEESSIQVGSSLVTLNFIMVDGSYGVASVALVCCVGVLMVGEGGGGEV